ncbi:hypothetical protein MSIMFB_00771 [Mycobacterium simulans]|uniref:Uncharacterized protein n=1 Tax=Mycobacterium simulans TaxID=627089 RepID=A0A7Z7IID5_9MYCO|nr:hypothetical protein MSIMFB_00771 [Mycobacterium simulans]
MTSISLARCAPLVEQGRWLGVGHCGAEGQDMCDGIGDGAAQTVGSQRRRPVDRDPPAAANDVDDRLDARQVIAQGGAADLILTAS